ncbi:TolC family protein [Rhizobium sp. L1K21]|uniref:TolC family protein n=1 Tax=Rhizobium sp. L1K21 TaxID=2954933 RepID=UPI0020935E98|nr:TolC family protein [Rhizobium sp. L1K21]MCO6187921.1 TolC family protein [Rhizobium sp. L1K21]
MHGLAFLSRIATLSLASAMALGGNAYAEDGWALRTTVSSPSTIESYELRAGLQSFVSPTPGLRGALETAVERNANWHAALSDVTAADREVWSALLKYAPVITGSVETNAYSPAGSSGLDLKNRDSYLAVVASLPVWTSGGRYYGVKAARSHRDMMTYEALAVRDQAKMDFIETWTQAVAALQDRRLARRAVERFQRLRRAVVARQNSGFASVFDISQIDADIAAARQALVSIEGMIEKLGNQLVRKAGSKPASGATLNRFADYLKGGKQAFIESAHRNNPQLRAASAQYRTELYSTSSSMSRFLPSVSLSGEFRHYMNRSPGSTGNQGWRVGIKLNVPLVDLSSVAASSAQQARTDAALYREAATLNAVETQIDDLWSDYQTTLRTRREAEREVDARKKSANSTLNRFEKGFGSLEDAISAETALSSAERTALQFFVRESITAAQLLLVSGKFHDGMLTGH